MKNLLVDSKQADHPINNTVSFQEGRTNQDTCMNRCKVLYIVLYLDHALPVKKRKTVHNRTIEDNESAGISLWSLSKKLRSHSEQLLNEVS